MANKIVGKVTQVQGVLDASIRFRIRAWDDDWPDEDDLLGESLTGGDGQYTIPCMGGIYDGTIPGIKTSYPDIYITADIKNQRNDWVRLAKSQVFNNYDLSEDLRIDLDVAIEPIIHFPPILDPKVQGFHFRNDFRYRPDFLNIEFFGRGRLAEVDVLGQIHFHAAGSNPLMLTSYIDVAIECHALTVEAHSVLPGNAELLWYA